MFLFLIGNIGHGALCLNYGKAAQLQLVCAESNCSLLFRIGVLSRKR